MNYDKLSDYVASIYSPRSHPLVHDLASATKRLASEKKQLRKALLWIAKRLSLERSTRSVQTDEMWYRAELDVLARQVHTALGYVRSDKPPEGSSALKSPNSPGAR